VKFVEVSDAISLLKKTIRFKRERHVGMSLSERCGVEPKAAYSCFGLLEMTEALSPRGRDLPGLLDLGCSHNWACWNLDRDELNVY
jgi:hypothetical protein